MTRFYCLKEEAKEVYLLTLCDLIVDRISLSPGYEIVVEAIEKCWDWVRTKKVEAVWICIANTLAYIVRDAYLYSEETYMPETIECVDDETVESFWLNFHEIYMDSDVSDKLLDYMVMNYSISSEQQLDLLQIKQFVKDNM